MEGETPSEGIKELYKANLVAGRVKVTNNLLIRFPSLGDIKADKVAVEQPKEPTVSRENQGGEFASIAKKVISHGKVRKR